jgi:hypothetical protein
VRLPRCQFGEDQMNNLEITLTVIAIAVAQVLTILLTIGRERDIKELREHVTELRELVDEQRVRIAEMRAWLARRSAAQPNRIKSGREPITEPVGHNTRSPESAKMPKDSPDTLRPSTIDDELKRAANAINWLKDDADRAREIVAAQHAPKNIGLATKPIKMPGIHTAQEIDAEVLEMQRLELPVTTGEERREAYNRLTLKKQGNADALKKFDDALIKMMGTQPEKFG